MRAQGRSMYDLEMRLLVSLLFLISLSAQPPQDAPKKGGGGGPPKNLKVLKVEGRELGALMRTYTVALGGVRCDFCHVQGDFASDENPKKLIARRMITIAQEVNAKFPDGKEHVTCYTCHRGDPTPKMAPPPAAPAAQ
jgi:photosynthetic reaction center cytochrome c subunit